MAGRSRRTGPGCYRVMIRGTNGIAWGPIVNAGDAEEAMAKAVHLFPHCEPVEARWQHANGRHHSESKIETLGDALDAKINQADLLRIGWHREPGGLGRPIDRRRYVA